MPPESLPLCPRKVTVSGRLTSDCAGYLVHGKYVLVRYQGTASAPVALSSRTGRPQGSDLCSSSKLDCRQSSMSIANSIGGPTSMPAEADAPRTIARRRSRNRTCKGAPLYWSGKRPHKRDRSLEVGGDQPCRAKCSNCSPTAVSSWQRLRYLRASWTLSIGPIICKPFTLQGTHFKICVAAIFHQEPNDRESTEPDVAKGLQARAALLGNIGDGRRSHRAAARTACSPIERKTPEARKRASERRTSSASR
jgi:hypothetical protein